MLKSVWFWEEKCIYIFFCPYFETPFLSFIPFCAGKKSSLYFPFWVYSFTHEYKNPAPSIKRVSGKLLCSPRVQNVLYSIWKIRMLFFFPLFRFGQHRQKGNQSYRRFRFYSWILLWGWNKGTEGAFFFIPSSSMFPVSVKSLDT
jgi:hypothetical protein